MAAFLLFQFRAQLNQFLQTVRFMAVSNNSNLT